MDYISLHKNNGNETDINSPFDALRYDSDRL